LRRLAGLGITVKILTRDNPAVAAKVCADLGLPPGQVATGPTSTGSAIGSASLSPGPRSSPG
jgi:magnesium-transporting ATPase (P-type)